MRKPLPGGDGRELTALRMAGAPRVGAESAAGREGKACDPEPDPGLQDSAHGAGPGLTAPPRARCPAGPGLLLRQPPPGRGENRGSFSPGIYRNLFNGYSLGKPDPTLACVHKSSGCTLNSFLLVWRKSVEMNVP